MHLDCAAASATRCLYLANTGAIEVVIARSQERPAAEIAPEIALTQE